MQKTTLSEIEKLSASDPNSRLKTLQHLAKNLPVRPLEKQVLANMHIHSFFSYNMRGFSPTRIVWEAAQKNLFAAGLCDFDVLDGLDEFFDAGLTLRLRVTVNLETRAFLQDYAQKDINSPGEPGVIYIMGAGFTFIPQPNTPAGSTLRQYREQAQVRNQKLIERIHAALPALPLSYQKDVLPLSPSATPTERHIVRAYRLKSQQLYTPRETYLNFWAKISKQSLETIAQFDSDVPVMEDFIRNLLVKAGGIGYEKPGPDTFPSVKDFTAWVASCQALPMYAWLDGCSEGESDPAALLECLQSKGVCAVNIIPDRNHNLSDLEQRSLKLKKLDQVLQLAARKNLPVQIGTEMNKDGQPFVDDTEQGALQPYAEQFLAGAAIMVGHTIMTKFADCPYNGALAQTDLADIKQRNDFFQAVGQLPPLNAALTDRLQQIGPEKAYAAIRDSVKKGAWL